MQTTGTHGGGHKQSALVLGALGIVFGDIGTSPLYALKECFAPGHGLDLAPENVLGILSLIFWSLTLIVTLKYLAFIMRADNHGEGGIMALLALTLRAEGLGTQQRKMLVLLGIFGAALFLGDGIITPAISVLSATEGLAVATPAFEPYIVPIAITILIALFLIQSRGTGSVGILFGPIILLWFSTLGIFGLIKVIQYPEVLAAINPVYAVSFLYHHQEVAFITLGAVVLTVTGGEALYADMGHFGRRPIRIAWFCVVLPGLFLNYCGQGAMLLHDPDSVKNPFYNLAPQGFLYPLVVLATLAAIIASQAVISGVFSIMRQAMQLGYLPRFEVQHTSSKHMGQIYIPFFNWLLLVNIILLVLVFKSSSNLASAYGIAVTMTMLCDTILAMVVASRLWGWNKVLVFAVGLPFMILEMGFLGATSLKILQGGWFPLLLGTITLILMVTWKRGREILFERLSKDTMPLPLFITSIKHDPAITTVKGTAVFLTASLNVVPHALLHNLKHNKVLHEKTVFLTVSTRDVPYLRDEERLRFESPADNFYLVEASVGFKEQPNVPALLQLCQRLHGVEFDLMSTSFFLSRETLVVSVAPGMALWREKLFVAMSRNASSATDFFQIPTNRVVELGTQVEL